MESSKTRYKILLLEDEETIGKIYTKNLTEAGHDVIWTQTAEEAMEHAHEFIADVMIVDHTIQGHSVSGLDIVPLLHKNFPKAEIIMLSNYGKAQMEEECLRAGASHYLLKIDTPPKKLVEYIAGLIKT